MEMQLEIYEMLISLLPLLIPLVLLQLGLQIFAIIDIARKKRTKSLNVLIWIIIILGFSSLGIGSLAYLILGRAENVYEE